MERLPIFDFDGLTVDGMRYLVYNPFHPDSPLKFREGLGEEDLQDSPFFQLLLLYLKAIKEQQPMRLTQKGNLPRKFCQQLYSYRIFPAEWIDKGRVKILKQDDWKYTSLLYIVGNLGGFTKKRNNKLSLTKNGEKLLAEPVSLFKAFVETYMTKYNWAYLSYDPEDVAQFGAAFSIGLVLKNGQQERPSTFYSGKYLRAFPMMLDAFHNQARQYFTPKENFERCYYRRTFSGFMEEFGFVTIRKEGKDILHEKYFIKKTPLIDKVFEVEATELPFSSN